MRELPGTVQLFGLGDHSPVARVTGLSVGSWWAQDDARLQGISDPRPDISASPIALVGLPCVYAATAARPTRLVVVLHGGPDSHEWDDLRYGGAYRDLLDLGFGVLAINFPGSSGFGASFQMDAWRRWGRSAAVVARAIREFSSRQGFDELTIFGVSFGAWLGLQAATEIDAARVVLLSPVLELEAHLLTHAKNDDEFREWASQRFGEDFEHARDGDVRARACRSKVIVIVPEADEVVDPMRTRRVAARKQWSVQIVPGQHYPRTRDDADVRWKALIAAILDEEV